MNYAPNYVLKQRAKEQLSSNLGTVIGAFLLHMLCVLPVAYAVMFIEVKSINYVFIIFLANLLLDITDYVFISGRNYISLCVCTNQESNVLDLFRSARGKLVKIICIRILPAMMKTCTYIPYLLAKRNFQDFLLDNNYDVNTLLSSYLSADIDELTKLAEILMPFEIMVLGCGFLFVVVTELATIIFSQTLFILHDYQDKSAHEVVIDGIRVMKGHWGRYMYMQCSFILWIVLAFFTCGLSELWVEPYKRVTYAEFYLDIMKGYRD